MKLMLAAEPIQMTYQAFVSCRTHTVRWKSYELYPLDADEVEGVGIM